MTRIIIVLMLLLQYEVAWSQSTRPKSGKLYKLNRKIEIPVTVGMLALNYQGFQWINNKTPLALNDIAVLDKNSIWPFDRRAINQVYDFESSDQAGKASDWGLNISLFLPAFLYLDKNIKKDAFDLLVLYLETHAINTNLYTFGGALSTRRKRPFVYYDDVPLEKKIGSGTQDSFFSGHTSSTATASFFMAKVYVDYHPELNGKKWLIYTAALLPLLL